MVMGKTKVGTLEEILATRAKMIFPYRVNFYNVNGAKFAEMRRWCETHCKHLWRVGPDSNVQYFQFTEDSDAIMFMLKYGGERATL